MYPALGEFQEVCRQFDPRGVFRNKYVASVLGLPAATEAGEKSGRVAIQGVAREVFKVVESNAALQM
jgi:hypothetical protein